MPFNSETTSESLDNEAIRELRDDLKDLSKSLKESAEVDKRFTAVLFLLTMVQVLIALFQLLLSFAYSGNNQIKTLGIFMVVSSLIILSYFFRKIFPKNK